MVFTLHSPATDYSYIQRPPFIKLVDTILRTLVYLSLIVYGVSKATFNPLILESYFPSRVIDIFGWAVAAFSLVALIGSVITRAGIEHGVIWFVVGSLSVFTIGTWILTFSSGADYLSIAVLHTTLALLLIFRAHRLAVSLRLAYFLRKKELEALSKL